MEEGRLIHQHHSGYLSRSKVHHEGKTVLVHQHRRGYPSRSKVHHRGKVPVHEYRRAPPSGSKVHHKKSTNPHKKETLYKGRTVERGTESKIRQKPGMSNAGKYKNLSKSQFAGPNGTFPINTVPRARNALARAHFSSNPTEIRHLVYRKYPILKRHHQMRRHHTTHERE
jgi:hypothetical protein